MEYFISLERALGIINDNVESLNFEVVSLIDGIGRISYEEVYSTINIPSFDKSAMDGYALNLNNSNESFKVRDVIFAGDVLDRSLKLEETFKIMTGAKIPKGTNAVIKKEDVEEVNNIIYLKREVKKYENICKCGEDIKKGSLILDKDKVIDYADVGCLSSSGIEKVKVYKKPKIALITTGDELVDLEVKDLELGKIFNINKYTILSRIKEMGLEVSYFNNLSDDDIKIRKEIKKLSKTYDLIITTGGVSVGDKDLILKALETYLKFWKINIKPGSAMAFSKINNASIISLSGNPTAALTTFEVIVVPLIRKLIGKKSLNIVKDKAVLKDKIINKGGKSRFFRGRTYIENTIQYVELIQVKSGNGFISCNRNCNCLIYIKEEEKNIGEIIEIIKL